MRVFCVVSLLFNWKLWFGVVESFIGIGESMSEGVATSNDKQNEEDKRIRQMYQSLLLRRQQCSYWSIIEFPYLAEIVRHDSSYLRRILTTVFIDHPALAQCMKFDIVMLKNKILLVSYNN
ncbi:unnamed protein product [Orchesella dallaii]|uniref:Uncharacterized protein n=1 Tax=Orchesella dallaii TaxID=48710 RepID=A0ABP1PZ47_9HEXA